MAGVLKCMKGDQIPGGNLVSYWLGLDSTGAAVTLATSSTAGNCDMLDIRGCKSLAVKPVASGAAITQLTIHGCDTGTGTFVLLDSIGTNGVVATADSVWTVLDGTKLTSARFIRMIGDHTGTIVVCGKS